MNNVPLPVPLAALKIVTGIFLNCERTKTTKEDTDVGTTRMNEARRREGEDL